MGAPRSCHVNGNAYDCSVYRRLFANTAPLLSTHLAMKILFVQTGGTIDKDYPHTTKGWAFEIGDEPAFERSLARLNPSFEFAVMSAMKKDSLEITDEDRGKLVGCIASKTDFDKVVITHGTDTMPETAEYLNVAQKVPALKNKTIVITGAMRPERFSNSDADVNLGMAIATVQTAAPGIYLCMHGCVIPHDQIDRNMETGQYKVKS